MTKHILTPFMILFALLLASTAQSAQIASSGKQFNACTNSADGEVTISEGGSSSTCCSKKLDYCISCSQISCVKMPYAIAHPESGMLRPSITPHNTAISPAPKPPTLRDKIKRSQPTISTPTKAALPKKTPTVKSINKSPGSKISPATSKSDK